MNFTAFCLLVIVFLNSKVLMGDPLRKLQEGRKPKIKIGGKDGKGSTATVALLRSDPEDLEELELYCAGSVIGEDVILTTATCLLSEDEITVLAGSKILSAKKHAQRKKVRQAMAHPKFNYATLEFNYGLLKLQDPLELNSHVSKVHIANSSFRHDSSCRLFGWGKTPFDEHRDHLHQVDVSVLNRKMCEELYEGVSKAPPMTKQNMCARMKQGDACGGGDGGPMVCGDSMLLGVISWVGPDCSWSGLPPILSRTSVALDWITDEIRDKQDEINASGSGENDSSYVDLSEMTI